MEEKLSDIVLQMKKAIAGTTSNDTLDVFNDDYCKIIDSSNDEFVIKRKRSCIKLLKKISDKFEYDDRIKSAYDAYNEAITYVDLKKRCAIHNIPEAKESTPDFIIINDEDEVYFELKSLAYSEGNLIYQKSQNDALKGNISIEKQINDQKKQGCKGNIVASYVREVLPLGSVSLIEGLKIVINKIESNYKPGQYKKGETILAVDLNQLSISKGINDIYAIRRSFNHIGYCSGLLWTLAFGELNDRFYEAPEFEGKPNINKHRLNFNGVLTAHDDIKGLIFIVGGKPTERFFYGFYRFNEQDSASAKLIQTICDGYNDDLNSLCFQEKL